MRIAIIGGGAAGFFSAINVKENYPNAEVTIFEKSDKLLSKVKVSGGGRCNLSNGAESISQLASAYPRGRAELKKAFKIFNNKDTVRWFESRAVPLITQSDNCIFPESQDSQSIIDCFLKETRRFGIKIICRAEVRKIEKRDGALKLFFYDEKVDNCSFDKVIMATGGSPNREGLPWLEDLGHSVQEPVPSLFTFNMPNVSITGLMGIVVENVLLGIQGTKLKSSGPLLITHWGLSGPSVLKLSSFGARVLSEKNYNFEVHINWINIKNTGTIGEVLTGISNKHPNKLLSNYRPYSLPDRLWSFLLGKCNFPTSKKWSELGKKGINKLVNILTNDIYQVSGRTKFKDEFVTCGGVSLDNVNFNTMESKVCENLYFAGEVLDIDGITGGYNLQAAWTTAYIAGKLL